MHRSVLSIAFAALFSITSLQPSQAQREVETFLGLGLGLMQLGIQADQAKRQQRQVDQARNAEIARQRAAKQQAEKAFYTRVQTALKKLGFYTKDIDGVTGPGTRAAISQFQTSFRMSGEFDEYALDTLEWAASEGWRSLSELESARSAGFETRQDFVNAQSGGFTNADHYWEAKHEGFSQLTEYNAYLASGADDKVSFEAERRAVEVAEAAVDKCLVATKAGDWIEAIVPCYEAAAAKPNDAAAQVALETVLTNSATAYAELNTRLSTERAQLQTLINRPGVDSGSAEINKKRAEVNDLADQVLFSGLYLKIGTCREMIALEDWEKALPACYNSEGVTHLAADKRRRADNIVSELATLRKTAEAGAAEKRAALAEESKRLALIDAKAKATQLLDDVTAYSAKGNVFAEGLAVARQLLDLRKALEGQDAAPIERSLVALEGLLTNDGNFTAARAEMANAERLATQNAALEARRQAELLDGFLLQFISTNITSDHLMTLLPLSEKLSAALASGNAETITQAQAAARSAVEAADLGKALADYVSSTQAPIVTAEVLEEVEAQSVSETKAIDAAILLSNGLLDEIEAFAQSGGRFASPVDVARSLSRLKTALAAPSLPDLQVAHDATRAIVDADSAFAQAMLNRASTADASLANAIASSAQELTLINSYLLTYISANLTADNIGEIVDLQLAVENALSVPSSAETVRVLKLAEATLTDLELVEDVRAFAASEVASQTQAVGALTDQGLPITLANSELLEGEGDDFLVLRNSAAPHLAFDLVGNLRVDGGTADVCWLHQPLDNPISLFIARQQLSALGVSTLAMAQCDAPLKQADFAILRRSDFLALAPQAAQPLVLAFEDGRLKTQLIIPGTEARNESRRHEREAAIIAGRITNETARGYGLLHITAGSDGICPAVDSIDPHRSVLAGVANAIGFYFPEPSVKPVLTSEQAFVRAQRGQCSGIYANAADLRTLTQALTKADIAYSITPIWVEAETVEAEVIRLAEVSEQQKALEAKRRQDAEAAAALLEAKTADQRSALQVQQDKQRKDYSDRVLEAQKTIAEMLRIKVAGNDGDRILMRNFAKTDETINDLVRNKWTITDVADELDDYGTAVWRGRGVEAILVRITTQRESAIQGLYESDCWILANLVDREFGVTRDHLDVPCSAETEIAEWTKARDFQSIWHLTYD